MCCVVTSCPLDITSSILSHLTAVWSHCFLVTSLMIECHPNHQSSSSYMVILQSYCTTICLLLVIDQNVFSSLHLVQCIVHEVYSCAGQRLLWGAYHMYFDSFQQFFRILPLVLVCLLIGERGMNMEKTKKLLLAGWEGILASLQF